MPAAKPEEGTTSNRYTILGRLAGGGMADIFLAKAISEAGVERYVVLKRVLAERSRDPHFAQMFLDEARLAAQLQHPNIAQVHDIGKLGGSYFFTMEYVHGEDVRNVLHSLVMQQRTFPIHHALHIAAGALAALQHAHARTGSDGRPLDIVHRDVSPSNVMVSYEGAIKLLDFGVAKASQRSVESQSGAIKGKIAYLSPEQCQGKPIDRRSDIFALGIILWEMLTQQRLFKRDTDFAAMMAIVTDEVTPPSTLRPDVSRDLDAIVMRALAKDPDGRFETAADMLEAIETIAAHERHVLSATAMGRYLREVFGERPLPWVALPEPETEATEMTVTASFSGDLPDLADANLLDQLAHAPAIAPRRAPVVPVSPVTAVTTPTAPKEPTPGPRAKEPSNPAAKPASGPRAKSGTASGPIDRLAPPPAPAGQAAPPAQAAPTTHAPPATATAPSGPIARGASAPASPTTNAPSGPIARGASTSGPSARDASTSGPSARDASTSGQAKQPATSTSPGTGAASSGPGLASPAPGPASSSSAVPSPANRSSASGPIATARPGTPSAAPPVGGGARGAPMPGSSMPGSSMPGSAMPGSATPGSVTPGSSWSMPGSAAGPPTPSSIAIPGVSPTPMSTPIVAPGSPMAYANAAASSGSGSMPTAGPYPTYPTYPVRQSEQQPVLRTSRNSRIALIAVIGGGILVGIILAVAFGGSSNEPPTTGSAAANSATAVDAASVATNPSDASPSNANLTTAGNTTAGNTTAGTPSTGSDTGRDAPDAAVAAETHADAAVAVAAHADAAAPVAPHDDAPVAERVDTLLANGEAAAALKLCASEKLDGAALGRCGVAACSAGQRDTALRYLRRAPAAERPAIEKACRAHNVTLSEPAKPPHPPTHQPDPCETNPLQCQK